jgi:hypothetical protein
MFCQQIPRIFITCQASEATLPPNAASGLNLAEEYS